jgi:hypothetical protein
MLLKEQIELLYEQADEIYILGEDLSHAEEIDAERRKLERQHDDRMAHARYDLEGAEEDIQESAILNAAQTAPFCHMRGDEALRHAEFWELAARSARDLQELAN